jgi:uncharacterized repeat protein (TIGR03803 family)
MRRGKRFLHVLVIGIWMCLGMMVTHAQAQSAYSTLHNFAGGASDGLNPVGSLTFAGSTLYGLTPNGTISPDPHYTYAGTIFKINPDGTGYQILHRFGELTPPSHKDGYIPKGSLTLAGSSLYGFTTTGGGPGDASIYGSVFKINTDGTGYKVLFGFGNEVTPYNLCHPVGTPVISGSKLYGMTSDENIYHHNGGIFQMNTDGTGYQVLHIFGGQTSDGALPVGSLTLVGSKLYGMTEYGGAFSIPGGGGYGVIFSLDLDTSEYQVLHNFAGTPSDGNNPQGSLTLVGSKLYGMTAGGGSVARGVIFSLNLDGSGYQILFSFATLTINNPYSLNNPLGSLTFSGSKLYGMAHGGGQHLNGGVFQINLDGTGFRPLHYSNSFPGDGAGPFGDVTLVGSRLYGMTYGGGTSSVGVIFSLQTPQPDAAIMQLLLLN